MKDRTFPWTSEDLRTTADTIDKILKAINPEDDFLEDGDWRWSLTVDVIDDLDCVIGTLRPTGDGWFGFYPKEATYD
ncbi:hypothetical protein SEA_LEEROYJENKINS_90 [Microbacterium phage LeeroyJenkins]|nr:hypothetical protein SEA_LEEROYJENKINS_90 [Microbacterium phage LeeroyJenkins]